GASAPDRCHWPPRMVGRRQNVQCRVLACSRNASNAIFAFTPGSIFRLVLFVIFRSICCDGTAPNPISQLVPNSGSISRLQWDLQKEKEKNQKPTPQNPPELLGGKMPKIPKTHATEG